MDDEAMLNAFLDAASSRIEDLVTTSLRNGRAVGDMAIVLERQVSGQARLSCADRAEVLRALLRDPRLTANVCHHIEESMNATKANELPVVLVIQQQDAVVAGIRLITGTFVGTS